MVNAVDLHIMGKPVVLVAIQMGWLRVGCGLEALNA